MLRRAFRAEKRIVSKAAQRARANPMAPGFPAPHKQRAPHPDGLTPLSTSGLGGSVGPLGPGPAVKSAKIVRGVRGRHLGRPSPLTLPGIHTLVPVMNRAWSPWTAGLTPFCDNSQFTNRLVRPGIMTLEGCQHGLLVLIPQFLIRCAPSTTRTSTPRNESAPDPLTSNGCHPATPEPRSSS